MTNSLSEGLDPYIKGRIDAIGKTKQIKSDADRYQAYKDVLNDEELFPNGQDKLFQQAQQHVFIVAKELRDELRGKRAIQIEREKELSVFEGELENYIVQINKVHNTNIIYDINFKKAVASLMHPLESKLQTSDINHYEYKQLGTENILAVLDIHPDRRHIAQSGIFTIIVQDDTSDDKYKMYQLAKNSIDENTIDTMPKDIFVPYSFYREYSVEDRF